MRHYVPKGHNPDKLPHNVYMQMLYLIRDYAEASGPGAADGRQAQHEAVQQAAQTLEAEYQKRPSVYGTLNPLRAFFDYPYFSLMFTQKGRDMGASKRLWNLYRCRFAKLTAMALGLL